MANGIKTLVIAEKPSVARAIAGAIFGNYAKNEGYLQSGDVAISWCYGHLLEAADPDTYDSRLKKWSLESLPFFPQEWVFEVKSDTFVRNQYKVLGKLIREADQVIHAGDPDREGQLLVDEVFSHLKLPAKKLQSIQRAIITDLSPNGIQKALHNLHSNSDYANLSASALARQKADWLLGINLSRATTLYAQQVNFKGVLSIGRVFTPLLAMIVRRDEEIENFVPHDYFQVYAQVKLLNNANYKVTINNLPTEGNTLVLRLDLAKSLKASEPQVFPGKTNPKTEDVVNHQFYGRAVDDEGRIVNTDFLNYCATIFKDALGNISVAQERTQKQEPPLGYALSDLQQAAFNIFNIPVDQTLSTLQQLYENGYVTYPRTDCGYLNDDDYQQRDQIITNLAKQSQVIPYLNRLNRDNFDRNKKSAIWNSSNVENHSAIIPTSKFCDFTSLTAMQQQIYQLVAHRYLVQFMPPAVYNIADIQAEFLADNRTWVFTANNKTLIDHGWKLLTMAEKTLAGSNNQVNTTSEQNLDQDFDDNGNSKLSQAEREALAQQRLSKLITNQAIVGVQIGDMAQIQNLAFEASKTTPPSHFNDATLLSAMTNIARYVVSPELRKILNDTDGLGTEATRAEIIKKLYTYDYCSRKGRYIIATDIGRGLIHSLPNSLTLPDTTAYWEKELSLISKGQHSDGTFLNSIMQEISNVCQQLAMHGGNGFRALANLTAKSTRDKANSSSFSGKGSYGKSGYGKGNTSKGGYGNNNYQKSNYASSNDSNYGNYNGDRNASYDSASSSYKSSSARSSSKRSYSKSSSGKGSTSRRSYSKSS